MLSVASVGPRRRAPQDLEDGVDSADGELSSLPAQGAEESVGDSSSESSYGDPPVVAGTGARPRDPARRARGRWRHWLRGILAAAAVLILVAASTQIILADNREYSATPAEPVTNAGVPDGGASAALNGLTGPPTLYGQVIAVVDPATVLVEVAQRPITVRVIGVDVDGTPVCAQTEAAAFARRALAGQFVTLVPDSTLPVGSNTQEWASYLVLATRQSYSDLALRAGWVTAGQGRYRPGFLEQERQARASDAGMWGPSCDRP